MNDVLGNFGIAIERGLLILAGVAVVFIVVELLGGDR